MERPAYPPTRRDEIREVLHGLPVQDPYRWLEDAASPEVQAWMAAQDAIAREQLARAPERDAIAARLKELYYAETMGIPKRRQSRYFYTMSRPDREKAIVYVRDEAGERALLDPNAWSEDGSTSLGVWRPSRDGRLVVYAMRPNNSDAATLHVKEVESGRISEIDVITGARYAVPSWTPDSSGFVYAWVPTDPDIPVKDRPGHVELRFHRLGTDPRSDERLHGATGDPRTFLSGELSWDGRWLVVTISHGWDSNDVFYRDMSSPGSGFVTLSQGVKRHLEVHPWRDVFYVRTDDGAPRGRIVAVDPHRPAREHWREIVPEPADATIESFGIVGERLTISYIRHAASLVEVRELDGRHVRDVPLPDLATATILVGRPDEDDAYYAVTSFTEPGSVWATSVATGETRLHFRPSIPIDAAGLEARQEWFTSKDGTRVPMFLVHKKGLVRDGSHPALLTGYGGFQVARTPAFSPSIVPLVERGFVFALPNLRGGSEFGEQWHEDGRGPRKQNTFDDFIAAAEHLVDAGYTRPAKLAISGGSNGGLLVGAAMTQRPELFGAVICAVPLLDMVRYHLFGSGMTWTSEYGSAEDPEQLRVLLDYSPYHRVREGTAYPPMLMLSADSDDRVDPMHARKFTAAVQHASTGGVAILRIERQAGHTGADLVRSAIEMDADRWAFLLMELGADRPG